MTAIPAAIVQQCTSVYFPYTWTGKNFSCTLHEWGDCIVKGLKIKKRFIVVPFKLLEGTTQEISDNIEQHSTSRLLNGKRRVNKIALDEFVKTIHRNDVQAVILAIKVLKEDEYNAYSAKNGNIIFTKMSGFKDKVLGYAALNAIFEHTLKTCTSCTATDTSDFVSGQYQAHLRHVVELLLNDPEYISQFLDNKTRINNLYLKCKTIAHCCLKTYTLDELTTRARLTLFVQLLVHHNIKSILEEKQEPFYAELHTNLKCGVYSNWAGYEMLTT
jgi:hypothetical protein